MKLETLKIIANARSAKRSVVRALNLETHEERVIEITGDLSDPLTQAAQEAALADKSCEIELENGERYFLNVFNAPLRLIIVGAGHIAQPLSVMAETAGYDVTIVDPREAFASRERFPTPTLSHQWPDEALRSLRPDRRTAIVTLSHDPKIDDPALTEALKSQCFYIGALGSRKTHAARRQRLEDAGYTASQLARIHGPVGLDIAARSPAEIAISILAEITERLRKEMPREKSRITAIVLAAGRSARMGKKNKLLVDIGGKPMIRHVVDRILESQVAEVLVVLGHEQSKVQEALLGTNVTFVDNPSHVEGMSTSIKSGLKALAPESNGAIICLGDMPLVSARLIDTLIQVFESQQGHAICVPTYDGKRGNPVLWPSELFGEMLTIEGDMGAKPLIDAHAKLVQEVAQPDGALLFDIDTEEHLDTYQNHVT